MFKQPLFWLVLGSALVVTMVTRNYLGDRNELYAYSEDLPEILNLVDRAYVDKVAMDKLMPGVYQGAVEAVDPNASYVAPGNEAKPYWDEVYHKWGLVLARSSGYIQVIAVAPQSPAFEAGILAGNYLRRIGGMSTRRLNNYQVRRDLSTWAGAIEMTVIDSKVDNKREIEMEPKPFEANKIKNQMKDGQILWVALPHFYSEWVTDLSGVLADQTHTNTKLLLDLRNNAIGSEADLKSLASLFLASGELISWQMAEAASVAILNPSEGRFQDRELYVLVDRSTAWAAEIFAASAQVQGRAVVLGQKTQGLAWGYEFVPLKNGGFLQFCLRQALLPNRKSIVGTGVAPDWEIANPTQEKEEDFLLAQALDHLRRAEPKKRKAS